MVKKKIKRKKSYAERTRDKVKHHAKDIRNEFNKAIKTALVAAFGFLIALVWRDLITEYVNKISEGSIISGKLFSALVVTLICVLGIFLIAKLSFEKNEKE